MVRWKKGEIPTAVVCHRGTTLASIESLAVPLVHEVVFLADFRCPKCQQRISEIISKINGETQSVAISVVEKKVTLTCAYPKQAASLHRTSWSLIARLFRSH